MSTMSLEPGIRRLQLRVFIFFVCFYGLFFSGTFYSSDEVLMGLVTRNIVEHGKLTFEETYGQTSTGYGVAQSLAGVPFYLLDRLLKLIDPALTKADIGFLPLTNVLITALLCLYFFRLVLVLVGDASVALASALVLGCATLLVPYSQTFFSEPLSALCFLAAFYYVVAGPRRQSSGAYAKAGLFFAFGVLTKFSAILFLPLYILFYIGNVRHESSEDRSIRAGVICWLIVPALVALILTGCINYGLRGSFLRTAYEGSDFTTNIFTGAYGSLVSVGRGLFLYNPVLLVSLMFFPRCFRRKRRIGLFILVFFLLQLYLYGKFWTWHAGWTLGSRFLLASIPFLLLPLSIGLKEADARSALRWLFVWLVVGASFVVQLLNTVVNPIAYNNEIWGLLSGENAFLFIPQVSSLAGAWYLIRDGKIQLWLYRLFAGEFHWVLAIFYGLCGVGICYSTPALKKLPGWLSDWAAGLRSALRSFFRLNRWVPIWLVLFVICAAGVNILQGPRGLLKEHLKNGMPQQTGLDKRLRFSCPQGAEPGEVWHWAGYLEAPLTGAYEFYMKVKGTYSVLLSDKQIFLNTKEIPQHLPHASIELNQGLYPITFEYQPYSGENGLLYVYWTIPGGGYYVQPIPGRYLYPERPSAVQRVCTRLWRYLWLIALVCVVAPILLAARFNQERREEDFNPALSPSGTSGENTNG
jgi:hypothetical protein